MKKILKWAQNNFLIIGVIVVILSVSFLIIIFFNLKNDSSPTNQEGYLLYSKNDIKIYSEDGSSDTVIEPSYANTNKGVENFIWVRIEDGNKKPINITYLNFDAMPLVQTVNDNFVIIPMISAVRTTDSVFVVNRKTREVSRYTMNVRNQVYMAVTNDGQKLIYMDYEQGQIVVMDANKNEIQRLDFLEDGRNWITHTGAAVSPNNNYVAFFTTNGNYDDPDFHVFVYDILNNSVQRVGQTAYAERAEWKDNNNFVNMVIENDNGIRTEVEQDEYMVK